MRAMISGGGALAPETQRFMNVCFCCPVGQGYGLTETCGAATAVDLASHAVGSVGPPVPCADIKLVSWEDGNYLTTDKPLPRGEVFIGGKHIAVGYYKEPEKTDEVFTVRKRRLLVHMRCASRQRVFRILGAPCGSALGSRRA